MKKKNKKAFTILTIFAALSLFTVFVVMFSAVDALSSYYGSVKEKIDDTTKATSRYLPFEFKHRFHQEDLDISCITCHHTEKEDFVSGTPEDCKSCHNAESGEISYKDSMHQNCVVCHRKELAEGKVPPTECLDCHTERK